MILFHIVGARPNFMKAAPAVAALAKRGVEQRIIHTGQHYDANMSGIFFEQLGMPTPDINLDVGSLSHAEQTAQIMTRFEKVVLENRPDIVLVYGDVNSTVSAALVCAKLGIPVGHVEAGLRSWDRTMPEEINRILTDQLADLLFTPSVDGDENLKREGVSPQKIHRVGNLMIDTLVRLLPQAEHPINMKLDDTYMLVTLHRPSNVDDPDNISRIFSTLSELSRELPVVIPMHPRTRSRIEKYGVNVDVQGITIIDPVGYLEFLALQRDATVVVTDSGGIQEETTYLGVPCLTVRENTERPITIDMGTNVLVGMNMNKLKDEVSKVLANDAKKGAVPPLWDGQAGERLADVIVDQVM